MSKHIINIPTNDSIIYKQILAFMNFLMGATEQERAVLAELIVLNHEYEALPADKRAKFILSTDMRKEVRAKLDIEEKQYNGLISRLKKLKYLGQPVMSADGIITENLLFKPDEKGMQIQINMIMSRQPAQRTEPEESTITEPVKQEEKTEPEETAPRKLAPPANGKDTIIGSNIDSDDIVILGAPNE
jgi:hypothetical protein